MSTVEIDGVGYLFIPDLSSLWIAVHNIVDVPIICRPKPRMTWRGRFNQSSYFEWVNEVRVFLALAGIERRERVNLGVVVYGGMRRNADLSNAYKAVEDALVGIAFPDDSVQHIDGFVPRYYPSIEPHFTVVLGDLA